MPKERERVKKNKKKTTTRKQEKGTQCPEMLKENC